jgi:hypothetical protein
VRVLNVPLVNCVDLIGRADGWNLNCDCNTCRGTGGRDVLRACALPPSWICWYLLVAQPFIPATSSAYHQ